MSGTSPWPAGAALHCVVDAELSSWPFNVIPAGVVDPPPLQAAVAKQMQIAPASMRAIFESCLRSGSDFRGNLGHMRGPATGVRGHCCIDLSDARAQGAG